MYSTCHDILSLQKMTDMGYEVVIGTTSGPPQSKTASP